MMNEKQFLDQFVEGSKGGGKGGGGGTQRIAQESPNTLQSKATLRVVEALSEGEILGLVNGAKSIFFDQTPLQNQDGSFNFTGITYETRNGTPDQAHIAGFPSVEETTAVGTKVTVPIPIVRTVTDADTDAIRVIIRIPSLTTQNTTNGDLTGGAVRFQIAYQPNGGSYITAVDTTISGKTVTPYERQYRMNLTGSAPWNIKVTRITADNTAANIQNDIYFSSYTRVLDDKLIYPDTALAAIAIDSELFGQSIPTRSFEIYGVKVKIPSNYNPTTRVYTGIWNGTFNTAWTDNPAWVLYDLLTNVRYGLGKYIDPAEVDKFGFYTIAQYCDGLVDNGKGGTEPRFTFNGVIESQEDALKVIQTVSSTFRGMLYWGAEGSSGVITAIHDAPKDAIKIFNQSNVIGGMFTYSGSALEARHSAAYVTWNDPANGYVASIEVVEDQDLIEQYGYRKVDVVAFGCTSRGQAHRFGKWIIDSEANETETVVFSTGLADAALRPGDVIKIMDSDYTNVDNGGRAVSATTTSLHLDRPVTVESGKTYTIDIVMPDGSIATKTLTDSPGTISTVHWSGALSVTPAVNTMWVVTVSDLAPRQFRVLGVKEVSPVEFEVAALLFDPNKFARVEQNLDLPTLTFTKLTQGVIAPPTELAMQEYLYRSGALVRSAVTLSWKASPDSRVIKYEVEAQQPDIAGSNFDLVTVTTGVTADIQNTQDGLWSFRVRAVDALGNFSTYLTMTNASLQVNTLPPDDVENFGITSIGDSSILSWDPVKSLNLDHYEIRFNSDPGGTWNNSIVITNSVSANMTQVTVPSRVGTYLIKAVTVPSLEEPTGIYSLNATMLETDIDSLLNFNFVSTITEDPDFGGAQIDTFVSGAGNLEITQSGGFVTGPIGYYYFHDYIDLGAVYTSRVSPFIVASGNNIGNNVDLWPNVDDIPDVDGASDDQWKITVQISTTKDDPGGFFQLENNDFLIQEGGDFIVIEGASSAGWTDYQDLKAGDYNCRAMQFRVVMESFFPSVTPSVENLSVTIDMPDIVQRGSDIVTSAGGTLVVYPLVFRNSDPAVAIAAQNLANGDYYTITGKDESGFTIRFFNSGGTGIVRTFDYVSKGYGVVSP